MSDQPPSHAVDADRASAGALRAARHRLARRDPFFAELARTRPDVDIVLLPPVDPRPPADPATRDEAAALADRVVHTAREVGTALGLPAASARQRWVPTGGRGRHRYVVRARFEVEEIQEVEPRLRGLARHLLDDGWRVDATPPPRLAVTAARDVVRLRASRTPTGLALRVESAVAALTDQMTRELRPTAGAGR